MIADPEDFARYLDDLAYFGTAVMVDGKHVPFGKVMIQTRQAPDLDYGVAIGAMASGLSVPDHWLRKNQVVLPIRGCGND